MTQRKYHLIAYKAGQPTYSCNGNAGKRLDFGWFNTIKVARSELHRMVLMDSGIYLARLFKEEEGEERLIEERRAKR